MNLWIFPNFQLFPESIPILQLPATLTGSKNANLAHVSKNKFYRTWGPGANEPLPLKYICGTNAHKTKEKRWHNTNNSKWWFPFFCLTGFLHNVTGKVYPVEWDDYLDADWTWAEEIPYTLWSARILRFHQLPWTSILCSAPSRPWATWRTHNMELFCKLQLVKVHHHVHIHQL